MIHIVYNRIIFALEFEKRRINTPCINATSMRKIIFISVILTAVALASCNVTRTITTSSEAYKRGDTSVVIQTKTIETYDASKKLMY